MLFVFLESVISGEESQFSLNRLPDNEAVEGVFVAQPRKPVKAGRFARLHLDYVDTGFMSCNRQILGVQADDFKFPQSVLKRDLPEGNDAHHDLIFRGNNKEQRTREEI